METLQLGILAALLQVAGYAFYGAKILKRDIRPNAISWLMFAYGTTLLLIVEWDRDASFALLALPIACSISSILVAVYALRKMRIVWPDHFLESFSFGVDLFLTVVYASTWVLLLMDAIDETQKSLAEIIILVCWNIGIFTSFFPLLRQVYHHPLTEHPTPWFIWSLAYMFLTVATYIEIGFNELILYPLLNVGIHGFIALHTAYWRRMRLPSAI